MTFSSEEGTPVITSNGGGATASISVAENSTAVTTVAATDPGTPLQTLTYSISGGVDAARFSINSSSGALTFVSAPNFEAPTDSGANNVYDLIVQVSDGTLTDTQAIAVTVTNVNEAPTATNLSVAETYTEDTALNLTDIVVSDVDNASVTVTLTLSNTAAGSLNTGTSGLVTSTYVAGTGVWTASGAIADVNTLLAALTFTPASNFNSNFTIATSVSDGSLSATGTKVMTGTAVNDAPTATNLSVAETYTEDTALNLTDIVVSDIDSANVTVTLTLSNTAAGSLNTGTSGAVTWASFGLVSSTNALLITGTTQVRYVPDNNNGETATFSYKAWDQTSGTASTNATPSYTTTAVSGGTAAFSASSATASISVTDVNDAPVGLPTITGTVTEDQILSVDTSGLSDADGLGAFSYQWLRNGSSISGATVSTYTLGDADVGQLMSVAVSYTDGRGTLEGALTSAQTAAVTNVNDVPVLGNNTITILEGGTIVLSSANLSATDIDNTPSGLTFTVSSITAGHFALASVPQSAITSFTQAQVTAGQVLFMHDGSETAPTYSVSVSDGTASTSPAAAAMTFTNVNDAPLITALGGDTVLAINDGSTITIDAGSMAALDDKDNPTDYSGAVLQITGSGFQAADALNLDTSGSVTLSAGFTNGSVVSVSGVSVGTLSAVSASSATITFNANSTAAHVNQLLQSATFSTTSTTLGSRSVGFSFNDGDGTANGGVEQSSVATATVWVGQAGNGLVLTDEDTTYTFMATDFDFTGVTGSGLLYIEVLSLPSAGTLTLNSSAVTVGQKVTKAEIDSGLLRFTPAANQNGVNYASFDFRINSGNPTITVLAGEPSSYSLNGGQHPQTDAILASGSNFGNGGTYESSISVVAASSTIDASYLAQGEILFNGYVPDGQWTGTELSAVDTWIQNGGILISTNDSAGQNDLASFYGLTIGGTANSTWHVADDTSPIMNGPFGLVGTNGSSFSAVGTISYFNSASLAVGDQVLAVDSASGQPTMVLRQHGSGWILFTDDEGIFRSNMTGGGTVATANDRLVANIFAWAANQVPGTSSYTMGIKVDAVNDDPINSGSLPTDVSAVEDTVTAIDLSAVNLSDIDSATGSLDLTLTTSGGGTLSAIGSGGVTVTGTGSGILTLSGTVSDLNTFLNDTSLISFVGAANAHGNDVDKILVEVTDNGNVGSGGGGTITIGTVNVDITPTNDPATGQPVILGTVEEDQTLSVDTSSIVDNDGLGPFSYQWLRNGSAISGATATTYTLGDADVNTSISVRVAFTDSDLNPESVTSNPTISVVNVNDVPVGIPAIIGTVEEDQTLTADTIGISDNDGLGSFGYQWLRDGIAIGGATASTYTLGDADVNTKISVEVTYTDGWGTGEGPLTSVETIAVANVNDSPVGIPVIVGTPTEDQSLIANTAGISDNDGMGTFSYQWLRNGTIIAGANSATYTLTDLDVGTNISVEVIYTDGWGTIEGPLTSTTVGPIANVNDVPFGLPVIVGTATEDQNLAVDTTGISDNDGVGTFNYQWLRNGIAISGASSSTYALGDADVNTNISVEVSYTDGNGTIEGPLTSAQTAAVLNVNDMPVGLPVIVGTVEEDQTISADVSAISDNDGLGAFSYQWRRDGIAISGATTNAYTLTDVDVAANISVEVTYTDGWGTSEGPLTSATRTVAGVNDAPVNTVPGNQTVVEETQTAITGISIADIDANGLDVTTQLQVINGVLDVTLSGMATIFAGGNSSADLTISGTVADINATLASLLYTPNLNVIGMSADMLTVTTNDGGNTGSGGALQDVDTVQISISNVNDEEVLSTNLGTTVNEGDLGSVVTRLLLETTDVDNTPTEIVYSLTAVPTSGSLQLNGINLATGQTFTQADINANRLTYDHNDAEVFSDSFAFRVDDGSGTISSGTFAITITPVNDKAPVITSDGGPADAAITIAENTTAVTLVTATDADLPIQTLTFSIAGGPDSGLFTIDSGSGALAFATASSFETPLDADGNNVYEVVVEVNDGQGLTSQQTVRVTVTDTDEFDVTPIVDNNSAANNIDENLAVGTTVGITAFSEDLDGTSNAITYSLDDDAAGLFNIDSLTGEIRTAASIDFETVGASLNIVVRATSADDSTTTQAYTITVNDLDEFDVTPVVDTDSAANNIDENIVIGSTVGITAFSEDLDATTNVITYSLDNNAGGLFAINSSTGVVTTANNIDYEVVGSVQNIIVRATSQDGSTATQAYSITINDLDEFDVSPIVDTNAAANNIDEIVPVGTLVGITAFSEDLDGTSNAITYSLDDDAAGLFNIDSLTGEIRTAASIDFETVGASLNIVVRATSADDSTTTQAYIITVNDLDEFDVTPVVDTDSAANNIDENIVIGSTVGITAFSEDLDATTNVITYSLDNNAGGLFAINSSTGVVTTANNIDYEAIGSLQNIVVRATSQDGSTATQAYSITINDLDEFDVSPIVDTNAAANNIDENVPVGTLVGITAFSEDLDGTSNAITYSLDDDAAGLFNIDSLTGEIRTAASIDFEAVGASLNIVVRATSADDSSTTRSEVITINDLNDRLPVISSGQSFSVLEHASVGTVVGKVLAFDEDSVGQVQGYSIVGGNSDGVFAIDAATGVLSVSSTANLDHELSSSYTLSIQVNDGVNVSAVESVTVAVVDENDRPLFTSASTISVLENAANGSHVTFLQAFDQDVADVLSYSIVNGSPIQPFSVDSATGEVTVADSSLLNYEALTTFTLNVEVSDMAGLVDTLTLSVAVVDINENPVSILLTGGTIDENSAAGTFVGRVLGKDLDAGDSLLYSLVDDANGRFAVSAITGLITVDDSTQLDFEDASQHWITVRATDVGGLSVDQSFLVTLRDVNEAPEAGDDFIVGNQLEDLNVASGVLAQNDFDIDGNAFSYVLIDGPQNGLLNFNSDGSFFYQAFGTFSGMDSFTYYITDGSLNSVPATVELNIRTVISGSGNGGGSGGSVTIIQVVTPTDPSTATEIDDMTEEETKSETSETVDLNNSTSITANKAAATDDDFAGLTGLQNSSTEILRTTSSELFVAVFLDEVPDGNAIGGDSRQSLRDRTEGSQLDKMGLSNYLFAQIETTSPFIAVAEFNLNQPDLIAWQEERRFREQIIEKVVIGSTAAVSTSFSVGYVVWMLKGGSLLSTVLSSIPAWQTFDPLPVLESFEENGDLEDGESLASLVSSPD